MLKEVQLKAAVQSLQAECLLCAEYSDAQLRTEVPNQTALQNVSALSALRPALKKEAHINPLRAADYLSHVLTK